MKTIFHPFRLTLLFGLMISLSFAQTPARPKVAVLQVDAQDLDQGAESLGNLLRLELQRTGAYEVFDKYDMLDMLKGTQLNLDDCYSRNCMMEAGQLLQADKVITGSAENYGDKILISLKMLDVATHSIEKNDVSEYLDMQEEIQYMLKMSLNKLLGEENDPNLVNHLTYYSTLTISPTTRIVNNGPRLGMAVFTGGTADRLSAPINEGGYGMTPYMTQFGYQHELQYMSSGNFQALVEMIGLISGLEQSQTIPSFVLLNGFRENKYGFEFGFGPSFSIRKVAEGYLDDANKWQLASNWDYYPQGQFIDNPNPIFKQLDRRGNPELYTRWIWSVGKTFRSGYLNIPVNIYASYLKDDLMLGFSAGFNIRKARRK